MNTPPHTESADLRLWSSVRVLLPQSALVFLLFIECKLVTQTQEKDLLMDSDLQSGGLEDRGSMLDQGHRESVKPVDTFVF